MPKNYDAFQQGVAFGGLRSKGDIRLLLCYLLKTLKTPVPKSLLTDAVLEEGLANYFEIGEALPYLLESGCATLENADGEELYSITEHGEYNAGLIDSRLPRSVRDKAASAALRLITIYRREKENDIKITKDGDNFRVDIDIFANANKKNDEKILSFTVYASDSLQAEKIKKGFLANPANVCEALMESLLNNEFVGDDL